MNDLRDIHDELGIIEAELRRLQSHVDAGELVDVSDLDRQVNEVCGRIADVPASETPPLTAALISLMADLGQLSRTIETRLGEISQVLGETTERARAAGAYGRSASGGPRGR